MDKRDRAVAGDLLTDIGLLLDEESSIFSGYVTTFRFFRIWGTFIFSKFWVILLMLSFLVLILSNRFFISELLGSNFP